MNGIILVANELKELLLELPKDHRIVWFDDDRPPSDSDAVALVTLLSHPVGVRELDGLPSLKAVCNVAVGYDNVDLAAAAERGVTVTNTPDVLTNSTADLTFGLILAVTRRFNEGARLIERGEWKGWHPTLLLGLELQGATLGIIGAGRIGRAVGTRAAAFGMNVLYTSRTAAKEFEHATKAVNVDLERLLRDSDVVSVHVPLTSETEGMLGESEFAAMKRGSYVVNTARGGIIDEGALAHALDDGRLGGAGLDVFEGEPEVDRRLLDHPKVLALPHLGSATVATRRAMANLAMDNAVAVLSGGEPLTPVTR